MPLRTGWYFARRCDLDRAYSVKRTLLPSGFTVPEFLQAEDVWDLRQAGDKRVSGISVVFYAGAEENGSVDLEEEAKQF